MTSKERVIRTITFSDPDRLPVDLWVIPAANDKYGEHLEQLLKINPLDIARIENDCVSEENRQVFSEGTYVDSWGCVWSNIHGGFCGQVKSHPLEDISAIDKYKAPLNHLTEGWSSIAQKLDTMKNKFIICSQVNPFERMQFIRGTEALFMDLAYGEEKIYRLRDIIHEYFEKMIEIWLKYDEIDAVAFTDDWGTQKSLLISPKTWRAFFKPMYKSMIDKVKMAGKYVFFHSDGYIMDIYEDFIELGVDAVNSQIWCMEPEEIAQRFGGRITFWGEISRQDTLPFKSPKEVKEAAQRMKRLLFVNGGGLIGQSEVGPDVPLENIEEALGCWNEG